MDNFFKNRWNIFVICLFTGISSACFSDPFSFLRTSNPYSQLYIGPQVSGMQLVFEGQPANETHFSGAVTGGMVEYSFCKPWNIYVDGNFMWSTGSLTNDSKNRRIIHHQRTECQLGYTFPFAKGHIFEFTPFLGLGFNYFSEYIKGPVDYSLSYSSYYVPVGFLLMSYYQDWLFAGVRFIWLAEFDSYLKISFQKGVNWKIGNQNNLHVDLPIGVRLGSLKQFGCKLQPYWTYLRQGKPSAVTSVGTSLGINHQYSTTWGCYFLIGYYF